ncbi:MAG: glycoside hydrolase family 3 N-terminal domain-containing protein [Candidatus Dormibacteria bacterium]|jgi:beta-N-acetylhexosaminidase
MAATQRLPKPSALVTLLGAACLVTASANLASVAPGPPPHPPRTVSAAPPEPVLAAAPLPSAVTAATTSSPSPFPSLAVISSWSVARRAAQLVVVSAQETDVAAVAPSVAEGAGGILLYGTSAPGNLDQQLQALEASAEGGLAPLVMTDEEGGGIQRMSNLVGTIPWPATMSATMTPAAVYQLAETAAEQMVANGVTMDLAPVLDLATGPGPDATHIDGPRSFGLAPATATAYGLAFASGLEAGGVMPVVKHFPGEGSATANTDDGPASTSPLSILDGADLLPFEVAVQTGIPAIMVGDASIPGLTEGPASLSPAAITGLLRQQLGFEGLVLTDSLSAPAVSELGLSVAQASVQAVEAGADMLLSDTATPNLTFQQTVNALVAAVSDGQLSTQMLDTAVLQVVTAKEEGPRG